MFKVGDLDEMDTDDEADKDDADDMAPTANTTPTSASVPSTSPPGEKKKPRVAPKIVIIQAREDEAPMTRSKSVDGNLSTNAANNDVD